MVTKFISVSMMYGNVNKKIIHKKVENPKCIISSPWGGGRGDKGENKHLPLSD